MLPRHLLARVNNARLARLHPVIHPRPILLPRHVAPFHSSQFRANKKRESSDSGGDLPKSPFQTFVDVLREEIQKNRELQEGVKQLQGDVDKLQDSEAMKRAKEVYERARVCYMSL